MHKYEMLGLGNINRKSIDWGKSYFKGQNKKPYSRNEMNGITRHTAHIK